MSDDADVRKAIRAGKLVVKNSKGHIFYGRKWLKESEGRPRPIPGEVVVILSDDQWDGFARAHQLSIEAD